ncbi:ZASP protein, partial [Acromyrmex charruanus]
MSSDLQKNGRNFTDNRKVHVQNLLSGKTKYCAKLSMAAVNTITTDIKLSRCKNQPWGFRLSGGVDFIFPLTVVRVTIGGLAHIAGLQAGDIVIRVNGEPISQLTHMQVHDKLVNIGNDIVLSVVQNHEIVQQK